MKIFFGCKKSLAQPSPIICLALAVLILVSAGCGKAPKPVAETPANPPDAGNQAVTAPAPAQSLALSPAAVLPAVTAPNGGPDLGELNRCLIRWVVRNRRPPANFDDFAATAGVTIPPPPPGKKYFIAKNMHVLLMDQ